MFAAIDTYVVVLALPDMMASVDIAVDELQRAAPIISGFLLGYVAMLPLIGRIADLRGPVPVLAASLVAFAIGSVVTAVSYDLPSMVLGRFLQGVGGGGLVPATMALVAALYPVERRGLPLGLVSAVQEFGAVLGPLFGAAVLSFTDLARHLRDQLRGRRRAAGSPVRVLRAAGRRRTAAGRARPRRRRRARRLPGCSVRSRSSPVVAAVWSSARRSRSSTDLTYGELFVPLVAGGGRWLSRWAWSRSARSWCCRLRCLLARRPLLDVAGWARSLAEADLAGAAYLAVGAGRHRPGLRHRRPRGVGVLRAGSVVPARLGASPLVALVVHLRRADDPLVPRGALARAAGVGLAGGQPARRLGADRGAGRHPALRPHRREGLHPARRRAGAAALPGRAAGRRRRRRPARAPPARRGDHRGRHGSPRRRRSGGCRTWDQDALGSSPPTVPLVARRARLRPRPGPGQRRHAGHDPRRRPRPGERAGRRGPDDRHARRHLGADDLRPAPALRRPPRRPRPRRPRPGHPAGAVGLPGRRRGRAARRRARASCCSAAPRPAASDRERSEVLRSGAAGTH